MTEFDYFRPAAWIPVCLSYLLCFLINILILRHEVHQRKSTSPLFTTENAKTFSLLCMICGVLYGIFGVLRYLNITCYVAQKLCSHFFVLQGAFMGLYQLDRLYYCFSQDKVYSDKGYSIHVFYAMYIYCGLLAIVVIPAPWIYSDFSNGTCFIDKHLAFHDTFNVYDNQTAFIIVTSLLYQFWDITTLVLYAKKVFDVKRWRSASNEQDVNKRIMDILQRVLILTWLYQAVPVVFVSTEVCLEVFKVTTVVTSFVRYLSVICMSMAMSISMLMMQEHNINTFRRFLTILSKCGVHYVCCFCCLSMIKHEMEQSPNMEENMKEALTPRGLPKQLTVNETRDEPVKMQHTNNFELSVMSEV